MAGIRSLSVAALAQLAIAADPFAAIGKRQFDDGFDWSTVEPSAKLEYVDCYGDSKCARLQLPLDWTLAGNGTSPGVDGKGNSVEIAITTVPASVPHDDPRFGGTVIYNPGGPGGNIAGSRAPATAESLQYLVNGDKEYEFLFFDPRGVGLSTPPAECYPTNQARRMANLQLNEMIPYDYPGGAEWAFYALQGYGKLCAETGGPDNIFHHITTASVARDMLAIVDRVEEERQGGSFSVSSLPEEEKPRLQYIGVSYGSYLGNTFVSMFPGRTERILIDAIMDPDDYASGDWKEMLSDVEEIIDLMFQRCWDNGEFCDFKEEGDSGPGDLRARYDEITQDLSRRPSSIPHDGRHHVFTAYHWTASLFAATYAPTGFWRFFTDSIISARDGDFSSFLEPEGSEHRALCEDEEDDDKDYYPRNFVWRSEALIGIMCADSYAPDRRNVTWARQLVDTLVEQSPQMGRNWARNPLMCSGWDIEPAYTFQGPFTSPEPSEGPCSEGAPSAPMLITSSRLDNVTPLRNAVKVSHQHPDSSLVIVETAGHGTLGIGSECLADIVRAYFNDGVVPSNGTICDGDGDGDAASSGDLEALLFVRDGDLRTPGRSLWEQAQDGHFFL